MLRRTWVLALVLAGLAAGNVLAKDVFYCIPLDDLEITSGKLPVIDAVDWQVRRRLQDRMPYAVIDGAGEIHVQQRFDTLRAGFLRTTAVQRELVIRLPQARPVTGRLFLPTADGKKMVAVGFRVPADKTDPDARRRFYQVKLMHYESLLARRVPGAAWFRHEARQARTALGTAAEQSARADRAASRRPQTDDLSRTFALFTGGRALSENLQLDRALRAASGDEQTVDVDSIKGITIRKIDWKPLVRDLHPDLDPLSHKIPADQHAIFFPSFAAAVRVADELESQSAIVLQLAEPRSTSALTLQRYQRQMGLSITTAARLLGPSVVDSVALTGSDPYYRTGTDVAVLFATRNATALEHLLMAQIHLTAQRMGNAKPVGGEINGLAYRGFRSEDRSISSYVAKADGVVIVTNSPHQLRRVSEVIAGKARSIASLDEFIFFRDRYRRGDNGETAFAFLSDDTIRRWCGPRWRIAASRRIRAAAVLAELQAGQLDRLVQGTARTGPIYTDLPLPGANGFTLTPAGVYCDPLGSLAFMTPIAEQDLRRVTKAEAEAYRRWRGRYQSNWRWAFDPIGVRLVVNKHKLAADLTVMPLIWGSDYRRMISISKGAKLRPDAGDIHDALAHVTLAVNRESEFLKRQVDFVRVLAGGIQVDPLGWLGDSVGAYVDDDPFWNDLAKVKAEDRADFFEKQGWRVPLALRADVSNGLKLTAFLAGVRGFIEQAAPGMLQWDSATYHGQPYVTITPTERTIGHNEFLRHFALYYSASADSLVVTPNKRVLQRAIDRELERRKARASGHPPTKAARPWIGSNVGLQVDHEALAVLAALGSNEYQTAMQRRAWNNLFILNEWRRRYPDKDPVQLHERFWHERLVCPGGGQYRWNEKWQTMESTVYGCPADPREGPPAPPALNQIRRGDFGLTFEEQGLRARVSLDREPKTR